MLKNNFFYKNQLMKYMLLICMILVSSSSYAISNCRLRLTPFNFGVYFPMQASHLDAVGTINIRCSGRPGAFSVGASSGMGGSFSARSMFLNADILNYNFFSDPTRSAVWTDISGSNTIAGFYRGGRGGRWWWWWGGGGRDSSINFYGRVFANQDPKPGMYNDFVTITVEF